MCPQTQACRLPRKVKVITELGCVARFENSIRLHLDRTDTSRALEHLLEGDPKLQELFRKANQRYLYWDRFKQLPMPEGISPEEAWTALQLGRVLNRRPTPIIQVPDDGRFGYTFTEELQRLLMVVDQQAAGRIGTSISSMGPDIQQRHLLSQLMEEAIASSQIEGASTTRRAAKEMLRTGRHPTDTGEQMILNNYQTIKEVREWQHEDLTPGLLTYLQESLTQGTLPNRDEVGRFRRAKDDDDVVVGDKLGRVAHIPPPAAVLESELDRLCAFANNEEEFVHPLTKGALLHFWLAYLHPFCDGNGRTARALFYCYTLKNGYWLFEYVSISRVILRRRVQYERAFLYSETADLDVTYFLTFHLKAIEKALEEFWTYVERKAEDDRRLQEQLVQDGQLNYRQRALVDRALKDSGAHFTIRSHQASHNVSYGTARNDLIDLEEKGFLQHTQQGRTINYFPAPDLRKQVKGTGYQITG